MSTIPGSAKSLSRATAADSSVVDLSFDNSYVVETTLAGVGSAGIGSFALTPGLAQTVDQSGAGSSVIDEGPTGGIVPASETVTLAGSQLVFVNTYLSGVTDAYRTAVLFAEHELQSHFSNNVTITVSFGFANTGNFL